MNFFRKIVFVIMLCFLWADRSPENGALLNYTQVFFKWDQVPSANSYILNISNNANGEVTSFNSSENSIIIDEFIEWGSGYNWNICSYSIDGIEQYCSDNYSLLISPLPVYFPNTINILDFNQIADTNEIIIMDFESLNFSAALNRLGMPILFINREDFEVKFTFTEFLKNGNILGYESGIGYEIDLNGNIIFQTPDNVNSVHHQITKTSKGTYFLISAIVQDEYCPNECNPVLPDFIPWQGDVFREFDKNGNEIWSWNTFDHYDLSEYNPYYVEIYTGSYEMDWTHSNSVFYDDNSESIFISVRNLSRVTKIDYNSKEIVWNLGQTDFMTEIDFNQDLDFSQQHSVQVLDNGNLLFFDNHRYLEPELSRCIEVSYDEVEGIAEIVWEHILPAALFTGSRGECDRLENGNTFITAGRTGHSLEVTPNNEVVWHMEVKNSGAPITMYRSDVIPNLYPIAFSLSIDEYIGNEIEAFVEPVNDQITINIHRQGWQRDWFTLELSNAINNIIFSDSLLIDPFTSASVNINVQNWASDEYNLSVYSHNATEKAQSFTFYLASSNILGDLNGDGSLNILDIVILANIIISGSDTNPAGDLNQDGELNVLDIVNLANIILND
jgi:hypothetical protein